MDSHNNNKKANWNRDPNTMRLRKGHEINWYAVILLVDSWEKVILSSIFIISIFQKKKIK